MRTPRQAENPADTVTPNSKGIYPSMMKTIIIRKARTKAEQKTEITFEVLSLL